jgi:ABC-2 type transport system permease protein
VKRPDGKYDVTIEVAGTRSPRDRAGAETEVPMADFIDVGVLDKDGKVLALEREKITTPTATFTLTVDAPGEGRHPRNKKARDIDEEGRARRR